MILKNFSILWETCKLFLEKIEEFQKQVDLSKGISLENKTSLRILLLIKPTKNYPAILIQAKLLLKFLLLVFY